MKGRGAALPLRFVSPLFAALVTIALVTGCGDSGGGGTVKDGGSIRDTGVSDVQQTADVGTPDVAGGPDMVGGPDIYTGPVEGCETDLSTVLRIHYQNPALSSAYEQLFLWTWGAWEVEKDIPVCGVDPFGAVVDIPREWIPADATMGFKFKSGAGTAGPWYEFDRAWTEGTDCWEIWVMAEDTSGYCDPADASKPRIVSVMWDELDEATLTLSREIEGMDDAASYTLDNGATVDSVFVSGLTVKLHTSALDIQTCYTVTMQTPEGPIDNALYPRRVLDGYVTSEPLGSGIDESGDTYFRVFAPRATAVELHVAATPEGAADATHAMVRDAETGVWSHTIAGNQHGLYYWFTVDGPQCKGEKFDPAEPLNDPYALIAMSSFGGTAGRSMVFDVERLGAATEPAGGRRPVQDMIAWEVHVRDLTGAANSGLPADDPAYRKYLGFTVEGLRGPAGPDGEAVKTGLDHIVELGVNAVQILPVHEFPSDPEEFNWGYFTANFFSPEGMYASSDAGEAKALELKAAIDALHAKGIAVVLDVVFNHSAEGTDLGPHFNFKGFDSKYYYRQDPFSYAYDNGSGVGNELASERPMMRRYIKDCLRFWVDHYGVDGFRFDLAGLMDLETVRAVASELPDVYLYGEPWAASGALWSKGGVNSIEPWFVFNDTFRDTVKGSPEGADRGYIQGGRTADRVMGSITGNSVKAGVGLPWADSHLDSLLYLDAHDNLTLADKLSVSMPDTTVEERAERVKLAAALTAGSIGPIMLHAGIEFMRTKPYSDEIGDGRPIEGAGGVIHDANSYSSSDATNNLDWQFKADHFDVFTFWKGMIELRLSELGLAARPADAVTEDYFEWFEDEDNEYALGWTLNADSTNGARKLRFFVNPDAEDSAAFDVEFPAEEGWMLVATEASVDLAGLEAADGTEPLAVPPLGIRVFASGF